jgi:hypothetical protein
VLAARSREWSEAVIRDHAEQFGEAAFHDALYRAVTDLVDGGTPAEHPRPGTAAASTRPGAWRPRAPSARGS